MKITMNGYEVEIKARASYNSKANKQDTMDLLNSISIWVMEAANDPTNKSIKNYLEGVSNEIYEQLKAAGAYKNI